MSQIPDQAPSHVSVENQMPEDLFRAMREFIRLHPQWDQYRLMQAALAGFLFQHGCGDRAVARHYLDGLFQRGTLPFRLDDGKASPSADLRPWGVTPPA